MKVKDSSNIIVFGESPTSHLFLSVLVTNFLLVGVGLYSFFQSYTQECLKTWNCQSQILDIDATSSIWFYGLNTVSSENMLSVGGTGVIKQADNRNGFQSTVTAWSPA